MNSYIIGGLIVIQAIADIILIFDILTKIILKIKKRWKDYKHNTHIAYLQHHEISLKEEVKYLRSIGMKCKDTRWRKYNAYKKELERI